MAQLTLEKLASAIIQLKRENENLAEELRVVKEYLRKQHKLIKLINLAKKTKHESSNRTSINPVSIIKSSSN